MRAPKRSYVLWFSQRVGSSLLAQALEDTAVAGRPREWLEAPSALDIMKKLHVTTALELRDLLWREATTPNGVLGIKYGMQPKLHPEVTALMASVAGRAAHADDRSGWESFFPNCVHFFITRRDKVRLAVSWWRAIKSDEWHRPNRSEPTAFGPSRSNVRVPRKDDYDYEAIDHLLTEANLRERAIQEQFARWSVVPHTIVYEDFVPAYETTVRTVLEILEVADSRHRVIPKPAFAPLADAVSDAWYHRFLGDRRQWHT